MTTIRRKTVLTLALAVGVGALVVESQLASATHVRPKGATPFRASLVPAYKACATPNRTHGAPLAFPSCSPPVQSSNFLTVGTPDANGAAANAIGSITFKVSSTSGEVTAAPSISDVRCLPATDAAVCNSANSTGGPDYSGQLQGNATIRLSDHYNGPNLDEAATVQDIPFPVSFFCANTASTAIGAICDNRGPMPGCPPACPTPGRRMVVEMTQVYINDGGADGNVASQPQDSTVFMRQGIFIP